MKWGGFEDSSSGCQMHWFLACSLPLVWGQPPCLTHLAENPLLAFDRPVKVRMGVQSGWRLGQGGQQGAFCGAQITERLAEVKVRSGGTPAVEVAVLQPVEVCGENPLLVPDLFQPQGLCGFSKLRLEGPRARLRQLDELLGDGGPARDDPPVARPLARGPDARPPIHPWMAPEPTVFGRQRGLNQRLGDLPVRDHPAEGSAVGTDHPQRLPATIQEFPFGNLVHE